MEDHTNTLISLEPSDKGVDSLPEQSNEDNSYTNCMIYCLSCSNDYYYIGVTTSELRFRLNNHKQASKIYTSRRVYAYINQTGWDTVKIECIEPFSCTSRQEMLEKETEYLKAVLTDEKCLNNNLSFQTEEEHKDYIKQYYVNNIERIKDYRQQHRDKILEYKKQYRQENSEKISEYNKTYVQENSEEVKQRKKKYNEANKEKISKKCKEYNESHKEEIAALKKKYAEEHKEEIKQKTKEFRENNKEKISEKGAQYYAENKEVCQKRMKEYREKNLETLSQKAKERREKKKQENPDVSVTCEVCGGSYQDYRKSRHVSSKKHQDKLTS